MNKKDYLKRISELLELIERDINSMKNHPDFSEECEEEVTAALVEIVCIKHLFVALLSMMKAADQIEFSSDSES